MLEKSFGMYFFLKQSKNQSNGLRYIYLRLTVDGKSVELSTKRMWTANKWNVHSGRATGNREDVKSLNSFLDTLSSKIYQAKKKLVDLDKQVSAESIKNVLLGKDEQKRMILEIFQYHNDQMASLVGSDFAPGTLLRYRTSLDHTKSFLQWKYGLSDMDIKDLDYDFLAEYEYWFKSVRNCNHNTSVKYLSNFKKIVLSCVSKGWLLRDPFMGYKLIKKEVIRDTLTKEELKALSERKILIERISQVRDIFLFCCYTGLAYIDVKQLKRSEIITGIDGDKWIFTRRQKTESPTRLPLLPKALEIMNKYEKNPQCSAGGFVLPVLSNQKMNSYLKEIADLCGIKKVLTFHIARHTFATTVTLSNGVPIETVSKMLGHKSLKQTQHYAKILDVKISADMQVLKTKLLEISIA